MSGDDTSALDDADPAARAAGAAALGHHPPLSPRAAALLAGLVVEDDDPRVRAAALGALVRVGAPGAGASWEEAARDPVAAVRRRVAELAPALGATAERVLVGLLGDADGSVAESAAAGLGEVASEGSPAVADLADAATRHDDALVREAAVAALGAVGDPSGLPAVLAACGDRPTVRRRAVLALAAFTGPDVETALRRAASDRDWQVRQAAEDLLGP
jgi:HEAT repeat protein